MYIDTHCHISNDYYDNIEILINKIKEAGISKVVVNGVDTRSNLEVLNLVKKYEIVYGAIGLHPTELNDASEEDLKFIEEHIMDKKIVAIGEIGLDYHYDNTDKNKEIFYFKRQLELAQKYNKPVIVHSRDAIQDTYNIMSEYNIKGSIHCFSGSLEMAREFIKKGFYIGIGGTCTYKNAKNIVNVVENIDIGNILLETDSPYLTPEPFRGQQNDSSYIPYIANKIAEIKDIGVKDVANITTNSAIRLFDI